MDAQQLFRAGKLTEAIDALGAVLRDRPSDTQSRTFLFELLCFAGEYDRAEKHLALLGEANREAVMGVLQYSGALHAERTRCALLDGEVAPPASCTNQVAGLLNGKQFHSIEDSDPRIGARLEIFAAGEYLWIAWSDVAELVMEPPRFLRDTLWAPIRLKTGPNYQGRDLGELLAPAVAVHSWRHPDTNVVLGRTSEWCADENGVEAPYGLKMLLVDGEEFPFLEVRSVTIATAADAA